jgi:basic amino acid/polyamine antiporter, APA family
MRSEYATAESLPRSVQVRAPHATEQRTTAGLVRGIGRWSLVGLTLNMIVGAGIFGLPSRIYGLAGVWSLLAYLICAVLVTLITLCFAEVGSRFSETGGPYLYARVAFGPAIGFEVGWLLWLARVTAFAALSNLLLGYLSYFWPAAGFGGTRAAILTTVAITLTIVNLAGVRQSALVSNLFAFGKLMPLLLFVFAGLFVLDPQPFTLRAAPSYSSFSTAVLLLVFAFSGMEMAVVPAGEMRDPQRHIAFALLTATAGVALLYVMVQVVCIGSLPDLANSERPLVDASSRFLGRTGASIVSVGALISVAGTLNSVVLAGSRILFAMAEQGQLPAALASTHRRFRTPYIAILVSGAVMLVLALQGTFMSALTVSTVIRLLSYIATCIALPVLRLKSDAMLPRFTVPWGAAVAFAATMLGLWVLSNSSLKDARNAGLAAAMGLLAFWFLRNRRKLSA